MIQFTHFSVSSDSNQHVKREFFKNIFAQLVPKLFTEFLKQKQDIWQHYTEYVT